MGITGNGVDLTPVDTGSLPARRVSRPLLFAGIGIAFLVAAAFRWLTLTEFLNDHFDHVALAQQLRLGAFPVRDFVDEGMPLTYLVSAAAWGLVNAPFLSEAIIVAVAFALAASLSFRVAALTSRSLTAATLAVVAQIALYPRSYSYPKLLVQAIAITVAWWAVQQLTARRITALAAATALGYYFRHDHAVYLGIATIVLVVVAQWRSGVPVVMRSLALYAVAATMFVLPHLVYVQWAVGVPTYLAIARQYVSSEASTGPYQLPAPSLAAREGLWLRREVPLVNVRWTPAVDARSRAVLERRYRMETVEHDEGTTWRYRIRDTSFSNLHALQTDPAVEDTHGFEHLQQVGGLRLWLTSWQLGPGWRARDNSLALLFWFCWLLPVVAIWILLARRHALPVTETATMAMVAALALCTDIVFLRTPLEVRLPDLAVSHTVLGAWIGASLWRSRQGARRLFTRAIVIVATALVVTAIVVFAQTGQLLSTAGILDGPTAVVARWREVNVGLHGDKPGPVPSNPSAVLLPFLEYVRACSDRQDRLLYTWYSPEIYVVADRGFAGDHRRIYRRLAGWEQARTIARLQQQHVPFVIIPLPRRQWLQDNNPDLWRYIQSRYVPMTTVPPGDAGGFAVLRESTWSATNVYPGTNWPCRLAAAR
jgi:hypothetical protein